MWGGSAAVAVNSSSHSQISTSRDASLSPTNCVVNRPERPTEAIGYMYTLSLPVSIFYIYIYI